MPVFDPLELAHWCNGRWRPSPPPALRGVAHDTRALPAGALYVALRGERVDGHTFYGAARAAGAAAMLAACGSGLTAELDCPLLEVDDTRRALLGVAAGYRRTLTRPVIGITGSVGKSTVKEMTAAVLGGDGCVARTRGNWNNEIGLPLSLLAMERESTAGVFEVGMNRPGEIARLAAILKPDCGIVTTIGPVHAENFSDVAAIAHEKAALLTALPPDGLAVIPADSPYAPILRAASLAPVVTVAAHDSGVDADLYWSLSGPATAQFDAPGVAGRFTVELPVPGRHNAANAALAVALGLIRFGLDPAVVASRLAAFQPLPMRWERCRAGGIAVINDAYNANPLSMRAALEVFGDEPAPGGKWLVLGDMLELGADAGRYHAEVGAAIAAGAWNGLVGVGPLARGLVDAARKTGFPMADSAACPDAPAAADWLIPRLQRGDAVLLKASRGMALEQVFDRIDQAFKQ